MDSSLWLLSPAVNFALFVRYGALNIGNLRSY